MLTGYAMPSSTRSDPNSLYWRLLRESEAQILTEALTSHGGHVRRTAAYLGISPRAIDLRVAALGLAGILAGIRADAHNASHVRSGMPKSAKQSAHVSGEPVA